MLRIPDSPLCSVSAYHRKVRLVPARPLSALFLLPRSQGGIPLTRHRLVTEFRRLLATAGVADTASFRGYSFRRGAALWAFHHGVSGELIQLYGEWTSNAYKAYLEFSAQSNYLCSSAMFRCSVSYYVGTVLAICFEAGFVWWQRGSLFSSFSLPVFLHNKLFSVPKRKLRVSFVFGGPVGEFTPSGHARAQGINCTIESLLLSDCRLSYFTVRLMFVRDARHFSRFPTHSPWVVLHEGGREVYYFYRFHCQVFFTINFSLCQIQIA